MSGTLVMWLIAATSEQASANESWPIVQNWTQASALVEPVRTLERPRWIRHRVRHRERVGQIAARYAVAYDKVVQWNKLRPGDRYPPKGRRTLRVRTTRLAPERVHVRYVPEEGTLWGDAATSLRVELPDLRAWNWNTRTLIPGQALHAWVDPALPWHYSPGAGPAAPAAAPRLGGTSARGQSVGTPGHGRLLNGVQLPESPLYTRGTTRLLWGSSHTVTHLQHAFANFRHDTGFQHEIIVGAISRKNGRRLPPHRSHQSGRDVDIRLPLWPHVPPTTRPNEDEIDWFASWALIEALGHTGAVSVIFLEAKLHRRVYEAARIMGASRAMLAEYLIYPRWAPQGDPLVRHSDGHDTHIHVRFTCGNDEPKCRSR